MAWIHPETKKKQNETSLLIHTQTVQAVSKLPLKKVISCSLVKYYWVLTLGLSPPADSPLCSLPPPLCSTMLRLCSETALAAYSAAKWRSEVTLRPKRYPDDPAPRGLAGQELGTLELKGESVLMA